MLLHFLTLACRKSGRIHSKLKKMETWTEGGRGTEKSEGGKWSLKA